MPFSLLGCFWRSTVRTPSTFLDLEKASDLIPHEFIWHILQSQNAPETYVQWIQLHHRSITSMVHCAVEISPPLAINIGAHQGSVLLPLVFILCIDTVMFDLQLSHPCSLSYINDVFLENESEDFKEQTQQWNEKLSKFGFQLNVKKMEYIECGPQTDGTINIGGEDLKEVELFLGSLICSESNSFLDTCTHVNAGWRKWRFLSIDKR